MGFHVASEATRPKPDTTPRLSQQLDAVVLDHRVRQQLVGGILEGRFDPRPVGVLDFDVEHLALADARYASDAERLQRALDRLALRVENAGFQRNGDARLHFKVEIEGIPSPRNLWRPASPANL